MTEEQVNYAQSFQLFRERITNCNIEKVVLSIDQQPTFDLNAVPFHLCYSNFVTFITSNGNFTVQPSMVSDGTETFWIYLIEQEPIGDKVISINSAVRRINFESTSPIEFPFKISIELEKSELYLYCGEIYDEEEAGLMYNIYDEMILFFQDRNEAQKFERLINNL